MFGHIFGLILLGLGIHSPVISPNVMGDSTEVTTTESQLTGATGVHGSGATGLITNTGEHQYEQTGRTATGSAGGGHTFLPTTATGLFRTASGAAIHRDFEQEITNEQTAFSTSVTSKRDAAKNAMQTKLSLFVDKVQTIKDDSKKTTVSDIQAKLTQINTKRTDAMTAQLNKMIDLLQRIISKGTDLKNAGKDTSSLDSAIAAAQSAITAAQTAVTNQAGSQYVITITNEQNLKNDVKTTFTSFESDLKATYQLVVNARTSLSSAIRALATLSGETPPDAIIK